MARPRIWVNRHGKPVKTNTGISFNTARRGFYFIRSDGKRQEFRTWDDAGVDRKQPLPSVAATGTIRAACSR